MSNLVLKGDLTANFGEHFPIPYINRVYLASPNVGINSFYPELNIFLQAPEGTDIETLINQMEEVTFMWAIADARASSVHTWNLLNGEESIWEQQDVYMNWIYKFSLSDLPIPEGSSIPDYETLYDEEGNRILKFTYSTLDGEGWPISGPWAMLDYVDGVMLAWSTTANLGEVYDDDQLLEAITAIGADPLVTQQWIEKLDSQTSDIAYEMVWVDEALPSSEQVAYVTADDAVYGGFPLQSITSQYYESSGATHEDITASFQTLIDKYQVQGTTDSSLQNVLDSISLILQTESQAVDLLPQLNEYGKAFPSKTSATTIGQLYLEYVEKVTISNQALASAPQLFKKTITSNSKVVDQREWTIDWQEWTGGTVACTDEDPQGNIGSCPPGAYLYENLLLTRMAYPGQYDIAIDPARIDVEGFEDAGDEFVELAGDAWGANYGWVFFDVDKAFYETSTLARNYDVDKLITFLGLDVDEEGYSTGAQLVNMAFHLEEVKLTRYTVDEAQDFERTDKVTMSAVYDATGNAALLNGAVEWSNARAGEADEEEAGLSSLWAPGQTAPSYILLRNFDFQISEEDRPNPKLDSYGTGYVGLPAFRLMAFEFQDLMGYFEQLLEQEDSDIAQWYEITVTMRDRSVETMEALADQITTYRDKLDVYFQEASLPCSFNNMTNDFNEYFIDSQKALYEDTPAEAPWVDCPAVFVNFLYLLQNSSTPPSQDLSDESDRTSRATEIMNKIAPTTGNLSQLEAFFDDFNELTEEINRIATEARSATGEYGDNKYFTTWYEISDKQSVPWQVVTDTTESIVLQDYLSVDSDDWEIAGGVPGADIGAWSGAG